MTVLQTVGRSPVSDTQKRLQETVTVRSSSQLLTDTGIFVNGSQLLVVGLNGMLDGAFYPRLKLSVALPADLYPFWVEAVLFLPDTPRVVSVIGLEYEPEDPEPLEKMINFIPAETVKRGSKIFGTLYVIKKDALFES